MSITIGRNDPCPCGSGSKYKHCCLRAGSRGGAVAESINDEIDRVLAGRDFDSIEDVNAALLEITTAHNRAPREEFDGLSSEQVALLFSRPFGSPDIVEFRHPYNRHPTGPLIELFIMLATTLASNRVKATRTGNLPRQLCRDIAETFMGPAGYREYTRYGGINSETDFRELNRTRLIAEMAGLIERDRGHFVLTDEARALLVDDNSALYFKLFQTCAQEFNWAWGDRHAELAVIQHSFAFTLRLLARHGDSWRDAEFYADAFLGAFPAALDEPPDLEIYSAESAVRNAYRHRALSKFAVFTGLAETDAAKNELPLRDPRIRKTPLLDEVVRFKV